MTELERRMLELVGASEEDTKPHDKDAETAEALSDIWQAICELEIFGGEM